MVSRWILSDVKYAHKIKRWGSLRRSPGPPKSDGEGHPSPRFIPLDVFGVSISRQWGIGPRDNVFRGPAVALDGSEFKATLVIV